MKESLKEAVKQQEPTSESPPTSAALTQELRLLLQELRVTRLEQVEKPKKESSPLLLPILGGIGTLILAIVNNFANWYSTNSIEENKFNRELIQKVFTEDQKPGSEAHEFFVPAGYRRAARQGWTIPEDTRGPAPR